MTESTTGVISIVTEEPIINVISLTSALSSVVELQPVIQSVVENNLIIYQEIEGGRGQRGLPGVDGDDGSSAYEIAVNMGFVGTVREWLDSLKGEDGIGSGVPAEVVADFTVYLPESQGQYSNGDVITAGTSLETVVKKILQAVIPPIYYSPSLSISGSGSKSIEAGTLITPAIMPTFTQNDGGSVTRYSLRQNGSEIYTNTVLAQQPDSARIIGDETISYQASATYAQGPIKRDNQGNDYPTGQIQAGTATSNTVSYTGFRKRFYLSDSSAVVPDTSPLVRALGNYVTGNSFTINIPTGAQRVVFAYPASLADVTSVKYVELGNAEVKDTFSQPIVSVEGASSFDSIPYKVYCYNPAIPFGASATYTVTI
jgi:hypothetical protein